MSKLLCFNCTFCIYVSYIRRSVATYSFNNNVAFKAISLQGEWKSDASYTYLQTTSAAHKVVASFQTLLQNSEFLILLTWGLNPLFLPSCSILLNNVTKITTKCLVVINGPIILS